MRISIYNVKMSFNNNLLTLIDLYVYVTPDMNLTDLYYSNASSRI